MPGQLCVLQELWLCAQTASAEVRRSMGGFKEVRDNMSEGLRFYMSLQEAIAILAQQAGDYALTRSLQRCAASCQLPPPHTYCCNTIYIMELLILQQP